MRNFTVIPPKPSKPSSSHRHYYLTPFISSKMSYLKGNNEVSKIGSLLVKGHKMLAENCAKCSTVLMQDKDGVKICVKCEECTKQQPNLIDISTIVDEGLLTSTLGVGVTKQGHDPAKTTSFTEEVLFHEIKATAKCLKKEYQRLCRGTKIAPRC